MSAMEMDELTNKIDYELLHHKLCYAPDWDGFNDLFASLEEDLCIEYDRQLTALERETVRIRALGWYIDRTKDILQDMEKHYYRSKNEFGCDHGDDKK